MREMEKTSEDELLESIKLIIKRNNRAEVKLERGKIVVVEIVRKVKAVSEASI